jgi:hypothetical protein
VRGNRAAITAQNVNPPLFNMIDGDSPRKLASFVSLPDDIDQLIRSRDLAAAIACSVGIHDKTGSHAGYRWS